MSVISDALRRARQEEAARLTSDAGRPHAELRGGEAVQLCDALDIPESQASVRAECQSESPSIVKSDPPPTLLREALSVALALLSLAVLAIVAPALADRTRVAEAVTDDSRGDPSSAPIVASAVDSPPALTAIPTAPANEPSVGTESGPSTQEPTESARVRAGQYRVSAVLSGEGTTCAVINGIVVRPGDTVDGARVRAIDRLGADLEIEGRAIRLPISSDRAGP